MNKLQTTLSCDQRGVEEQTKIVFHSVLSEEYKEFDRLIPGVIPGEKEVKQDQAIFKKRFFDYKNPTRSLLALQIRS